MIIRTRIVSEGHRLHKVATTTRGVIFCHVNIKNKSGHDNSVAICGNQKWHGAAPSFVISDRRIISEKNQFGSKVINKVANNKVEEDIAWMMKYLIAPSVVWFRFKFIINGMKAIRLISNPIHKNNQFEAVIDMIVERIINSIRKIEFGVGFKYIIL